MRFLRFSTPIALHTNETPTQPCHCNLLDIAPIRGDHLQHLHQQPRQGYGSRLRRKVTDTTQQQTQQMKHKHLVVIGRIPDEENVSMAFTNKTMEGARIEFDIEMINTHIENNAETPEEEEEIRDNGTYVDLILTSESEIKIAYTEIAIAFRN